MRSVRTPSRRVFAVGRGQYENIGDIILRRPLLDWAREAGELHVYVGHSPTSYDRGLGIRSGDVVYRSFARWYLALLREAARGRASSVFKPGEIQLTLTGMKEHIAMVPAAALVRLRGGAVARVGVGSRNFASVPRALMWPSNVLSSYTRWRDDRTADYLGFGPAAPDLGFAEGTDDQVLVTGSAARDVLALSLRADEEVAPRPYPSPAWIEGMRAFADTAGLRIVVVSQVWVDDERSARLALDLGGEHLPWSGPEGHDTEEDELRRLYRRTRVAVSDRLHVLIAAATEGAVPIGVQLDDADKIDRHFRTIGLQGVAFDTTGLGAQAFADQLAQRADRVEETASAVRGARERLRAVRADIVPLLRSGRLPARRRETLPSDVPKVYHVGRAGEVPGGMTQVLNSYLSWDFARTRVAVITSRADPGDHLRAVRHYLAARARIRRIARSGEDAVVVVHLSERGSFIREGSLARLAARLGLPVVAHLHGSEFAAYEAGSPARVGRVLGACRRVISLSDESSEVAARHVDPATIHLVPNAIPEGMPSTKQRTVVFGGVVSHRKGIDVLQDAWRRANPEGWELLVVGPVRDSELVDEDLSGARRLGSLPHGRLMDLLSEASIAVLPSRDEAMPMFILEALAREACVISTKVGGIPAVLGDGAGIVVPPGDVGSLAEALTAVTADEELRRGLASAGRERFLRDYSASAVFPRVEDIWLLARADARAD